MIPLIPPPLILVTPSSVYDICMCIYVHNMITSKNDLKEAEKNRRMKRGGGGKRKGERNAGQNLNKNPYLKSTRKQVCNPCAF